MPVLDIRVGQQESCWSESGTLQVLYGCYKGV